ncbi:mandelate racemase/muconate lactonizing enzyme family protein [Thermodesulfobacteriota bacterium]
MKIKNVRTIKVNIPTTEPVTRQALRSIGCVLVFLDTDEGITGESLLSIWGDNRLDLLNSMVASLKTEVVGEDPFYAERIWQKLWREVKSLGQKGLTMFGLSAIDRACWDIVGKAAGLPIHKLLGACRDEVPVYASGLWFFQDIDEITTDAKKYLAEGFRAIKMRIGKPRIEEDVERVRAVRQAIGPDVDLMADANQRLNVEHAIRLGRRLEEFNLTWYEEPVPAYDLDGSARVAAALDIPIALGESEYNRYGFRKILEMKAADVLMPDIARVGGITELVKVAHMAEAYHVPVSPHVYPEQSLQIMGAVSNATYLEYMPWFSMLYQEKIQVNDGLAMLPNKPGIGFNFNPETIERYRIIK